MRIEDKVDKDTRNKLNRLRYITPRKKERPKKHQEDLSERDLENLMGVNMPTYKRCRGALRQR